MVKPKGNRAAAFVVAALLLCASCGQLPRQPSAPLAGELNEAVVPLARAALDAGQVETAKRLYGRLLEADPGSAVARMGMGDTALREGATNRALRWYLDAVAHARTPGEARAATLAHARAGLAGGDIEAAARSFRELANDETESVEAAWGVNGVGLTRLLQGDPRGAVEAMQEAVRRDPDEIRFWENLERAMAVVRQAERDGLLPDVPVVDEAPPVEEGPAVVVETPAVVVEELPAAAPIDTPEPLEHAAEAEPPAEEEASAPAPVDVDEPLEAEPGEPLDDVPEAEPLAEEALVVPADVDEPLDAETVPLDEAPAVEEAPTPVDPPEPLESETEDPLDNGREAEPPVEEDDPAPVDAPEPLAETDWPLDDEQETEPPDELPVAEEAPVPVDAPEPLESETEDRLDNGREAEPPVEEDDPAPVDAPEPLAETDWPLDDEQETEPPDELPVAEEAPVPVDAPEPLESETEDRLDNGREAEPPVEEDDPAPVDAPEPLAETDWPLDDEQETEPPDELPVAEEAPAPVDPPESLESETEDPLDNGPEAEPPVEEDDPAPVDAPEPLAETDWPLDDEQETEPLDEPPVAEDAPAPVDPPEPLESETEDPLDNGPEAEPPVEEDDPAPVDAPEPLAETGWPLDDEQETEPLDEPPVAEDAPAPVDPPEPLDAEADWPLDDEQETEPLDELPVAEEAPAPVDAPEPLDAEADWLFDDVPTDADEPLAEEEVPTPTDLDEPPETQTDWPLDDVPQTEPMAEEAGEAGEEEGEEGESPAPFDEPIDTPEDAEIDGPLDTETDWPFDDGAADAGEPLDTETEWPFDDQPVEADEPTETDEPLQAGAPDWETHDPLDRDTRPSDETDPGTPARDDLADDVVDLDIVVDLATSSDSDAAPAGGDERTMRAWRGDRLFVATGAHAGRDDADRAADDLLYRVGHRAQILAVSAADGDTWFQVNVGPFETDADAASVVGKVESDGYDAWAYGVDPAPSRPELFVTRNLGAFWVQAGAYSAMDKAVFIASVVGRIADVPAHVIEAPLANGGVVYRVRLGPVGSRGDLALLGTTLADAGLAAMELPP